MGRVEVSGGLVGVKPWVDAELDAVVFLVLHLRHLEGLVHCPGVVCVELYRLHLRLGHIAVPSRDAWSYGAISLSRYLLLVLFDLALVELPLVPVVSRLDLIECAPQLHVVLVNPFKFPLPCYKVEGTLVA